MTRFAELLPYGAHGLHWGWPQQAGARQRQSSRCVEPNWRTTGGIENKKTCKQAGRAAASPRRQPNISSSAPGHAPSPALEQLAVEPRVQPDSKWQLCCEAHAVDDAGLCECHLEAVPKGGSAAAAQTCRHAHRPAS